MSFLCLTLAVRLRLCECLQPFEACIDCCLNYVDVVREYTIERKTAASLWEKVLTIQKKTYKSYANGQSNTTRSPDPLTSPPSTHITFHDMEMAKSIRRIFAIFRLRGRRTHQAAGLLLAQNLKFNRRHSKVHVPWSTWTFNLKFPITKIITN